MKYFIAIAMLGFLSGCGNKDEDTGSDTAEVEDTGNTVSQWYYNHWVGMAQLTLVQYMIFYIDWLVQIIWIKRRYANNSIYSIWYESYLYF